MGDVLDAASLRPNMVGVHTAYYLVHAMASANSFAQEDRRSAHAFAVAARDAGVQHIICLGGLGSGSELSAHLRSRQEVGRILRESGVATVEFRASIVIGSGSASFEMIRGLVEKLPVMTSTLGQDTHAANCGRVRDCLSDPGTRPQNQPQQDFRDRGS
jgi:uncharacterized protein YbjT (DUF2867 family)